MIEEWRPVVGYEGRYEVSSLGQIASLRFRSKHRRLVLQPGHHKRGGYLFVNLCRDGTRLHRKVHFLVCEAFNGAKPSDATLIRHLDGDVENNSPENLAWGSASENMADAVRHGTHFAASKFECKRGHPLAGENLYINPASGARQCRTCAVIHRSNYENRKKAI